jgi:chloride channel protein, CIC family
VRKDHSVIFPAIIFLGIICGGVGVLFHYLIAFFVSFTFDVSSVSSFTTEINTLPVWWRVLLPMIGGLFVGLLVYFTKLPEIAGEGVPEVKRAIKTRNSYFNWKVAPLKALTTMITIGTGGSVGREGPIIQIGAAIGSFIATQRGTGKKHTTTLLLAGAAAAMAATFGTPVAAVVFVYEVLVRDFDRFRFLTISTAVLVSILTTRFVFNYDGLNFSIDSSHALDKTTLILSLIIGVFSGIIAVCFGSILNYVKRATVCIPLPSPLKPALGGLLVGFLALYSPYLYEPATSSLVTLLTEPLITPVWFLFGLLLIKLVATTISIGSGGSGGIFAPSLVLGLILGALVNSATATLFHIPFSGLLSIVGMAGVFAAAAHAPFTAVLLIFEITNATTLLPALIICCLAAYITARVLRKESMYHAE